MSDKIAIIGNISSLVRENESGGGFFEYNVIKRLSERTDSLLIPALYDLLYIINNEEIYKKITNLSSKLNISDIIFDISDKKFDIDYIMNRYIKEIRNKNVKYLYQPDYFAPHILIKILLKNKAYNYLYKLMYGEIIYLSDKLNLPSVVEIHGLADVSFKRIFPKFIKYKIKYKFDFDLFNYKNSIKLCLLDILRSRIAHKIIKDNNVKKILVVSKGVLDYLGIKDLRKIKVMVPANAVDENYVKYNQKRKKEDYAVFFVRHGPFKGTLEIPYVLNYLRKEFNIDLKIKILGKFYDEYTINKFYEIVNKFNLEENIECLGFVPKQELYEIVSKAKVMIYPSHADAFSISILESLALNTPVVAYDIAGPKSVFGGLPPIKFSKEFDVYALAKNTAEILNLDDDEYFKLFTNENTQDFIKKHSSWDIVATKVYEELKQAFRIL